MEDCKSILIVSNTDTIMCMKPVGHVILNKDFISPHWWRGTLLLSSMESVSIIWTHKEKLD